MSAPSFTYSGNVYTAGAAGAVDFQLTSTTGNPIPYLEPSHIHVYKSADSGATWTELTRPAQWDFVTNGTVVRLAAGISAGEWIKVQRITPSSAAYVTFQPSSLLTAEQLNSDTLYNTYLNQELADLSAQTVVVADGASTAAASAVTTANAASALAATKVSKAGDTMTGALAMGANKITGVGAPTDSGDAANKGYVDGFVSQTANIADGAITTAKIQDGAVTSSKIAELTIVDGDVSASAAIAGTKIAPDFGSQTIVTTGGVNGGSFSPTGSAVPASGFYSPGANQLALATSGEGRLFISANGKVGLNESSPGSYSLSADNLVIKGTANEGISIISGNAHSGNIWFGDADAQGKGQISYHHLSDGLSFWTNGYGRLRIGSTGDVSIVGAGVPFNTQAISFNGSAPVDSMVVNSSGYLGINTSTPAANLHVKNTALMAGALFESSSANSYIGFLDTAGQAQIGNNGNDFVVRTFVGFGDYERLRITSAGTLMHLGAGNSTTPAVQFNGSAPVNSLVVDANGNVGINEGAPSNYGSGADNLVVRSSGSAGISIISTGAFENGSIVFGDPTLPAGGKITYANTFNRLSFFANSNEVMQIGSDGKVSIAGGSVFLSPAISFSGSAPASSLVVSGTGNVSTVGTMTADSFIPTSSTIPTNGVYLPSANSVAISTNGTGRLFIDANGNVGVGVSPGVTLDVNGQGRFNNDLLLADATATQGRLYGDSSGIVVRAETGLSARFHIGSGEVGRFDSTGRLGLGTSSVDKRLTVLESANDAVIQLSSSHSTAAGEKYSSIKFQNTAVPTSFADLKFITNGAVYGDVCLSFESRGTERFRIDQLGRVGIGTTSPVDTLQINKNATNAGNAGITFKSADSNESFLSLGVSTSLGKACITSSKNGTGTVLPIAFTVGSSSTDERMRIDSSGRLLVGTSSARSILGEQQQLQIEGDNSSGRAALAIIRNGGTGQAVAPYLVFGRSRGTSSGSTTAVANDDRLATILFTGANGTDYSNQAASITAFVDGEPFTSGDTTDLPGRLVFSTTADGASSSTERMRITSDGTVLIGGSVLIGTTANPPGAGNTVNGVAIRSSGIGFFAAGSDYALSVARNTDDGHLVRFWQDGINEGSISVSGNTVSYNQFLGSHWAALTDWSRPEIKIGTILETINELTDWKYAVIEVEGEQKKICYNGTAEIGSTVTVEYDGEEYEGIVELETNPEFNKAVKVKVNDTAASKAVYGVFVGWNTDSNGDGGIWNDMYVGAVGNYVIRMAAGQEPEIGDLVEADGTGCAVVQDDDIIRTKTVAKITSTIPQVTYDDGSFLVTCVLYCG